MAPGQHVQREAHLPEKSLRLLEAPQFGGREEAVRRQFVQRFAAELAPGDPGDGLDIAQAARTALDVGLEVVGRVVGAPVAFLLLAHLGGEIVAQRPDALRRQRGAHGRQQRH